MQRYLVIALAVLLSGCQAYYEKHVLGNEKSPVFQVPVDSTFTLHRALTVSPHRKRVYFQNATIVRRQDVNEYHTYCGLELHTEKGITQRVNPDKFVVRKVYQDHIFYVAQGERLHVAQRDNSNGEGYRAVAMVMELLSQQQPDVVKMLCVEWGMPQDIAYITIARIRQILGDILTLDLATASRKPGPKVRRAPEKRNSGY